uniref:Alpha 2-HS glycoprotein n=1 Tax=Sphenodon punctatus TaxID=8508 RepID=A0A8D0L9X0_SPHPU
MKALIALALFSQLLSCKAVPHGPFPPLVYRVLDCDDPETEEAAAEAVNYINTHHQKGYKYALNRIEKVRVLPRRPFGEIFVLELDLLETTCHVVNPLPLENCTVRAFTDHAVEGDCDVKLVKVDGIFSVSSARCHSSPDSAEDIVRVCPDCPLLAPLNDTRVAHAVALALAQFNSDGPGPYIKLLEIARAQRQVNADATAQFGFCQATVINQRGVEDLKANCSIYEHQVPALTAMVALFSGY